MNLQAVNTILTRLLITLGIVFFVRLGTFLPIPGINHVDLLFYMQTHSDTRKLLSIFSGDDVFVIGLFTLNIFPYINASLIVQVLVAIVPEFSKLQKEGDLEGRRTISQLTRRITLIWAVIQSFNIVIFLKQVLFDWSYILAFEIVIWLIAGSMIVLWLSELITDYGVGNGVSILIATNILSSLPNLFKTISNNITILSGFGLVLLLSISLYGMVFLHLGVRKIPLISSKQLNQSNFKIEDSYIPLRYNQAGVMPIILASTILLGPRYASSLNLIPQINYDSPIFQFIYWISYFVLILISSSFYSRIILNPNEIADQLQKRSVTIFGVRPGRETRFYLAQTIKRVTRIGAILLATLTIIPSLLESTLNITNLNGLSTTSLLILTGVILDVNREIKNIYKSSVYDKKSIY